MAPRADLISYDPNIEKFDKDLETFLKTELEARGEVPHFTELYKSIKRVKKIEHLKKGEPMETIKFCSIDAMEIGALLDDKFGKSNVKVEGE